MGKFANVLVSQGEIFLMVRDVLMAALAVDEEEVTLEALLSEDLGGESIDRLDISFQLEKTFRMDIYGEKHNPLKAMDGFWNRDWSRDGLLTEAGIAELKSRMPYISDWSDLRAGEIHIDEVSTRLTVQMIVDYIVWRQKH